MCDRLSERYSVNVCPHTLSHTRLCTVTTINKQSKEHPARKTCLVFVSTIEFTD